MTEHSRLQVYARRGRRIGVLVVAIIAVAFVATTTLQIVRQVFCKSTVQRF